MIDIIRFKKMMETNIESVLDELKYQVKEYREKATPAYVKLVINKKTALVSVSSNASHECYLLDANEEGDCIAIAFIAMDTLESSFMHMAHELMGRDDCARHYYGNFESFVRKLTSVIMDGMLATPVFGGDGKVDKVITL